VKRWPPGRQPQRPGACTRGTERQGRAYPSGIDASREIDRASQIAPARVAASLKWAAPAHLTVPFKRITFEKPIVVTPTKNRSSNG